jgi:hypothetical protein
VVVGAAVEIARGILGQREHVHVLGQGVKPLRRRIPHQVVRVADVAGENQPAQRINHHVRWVGHVRAGKDRYDHPVWPNRHERIVVLGGTATMPDDQRTGDS